MARTARSTASSWANSDASTRLISRRMASWTSASSHSLTKVLIACRFGGGVVRRAGSRAARPRVVDEQVAQRGQVALAHLLLGKNIFKGASVEESRKNILHMPIPDFRQLNQEINHSLNEILHRALARDLKRRGFSFVGPTTMYAFMQSVGLVNDHLVGCERS